MIVEVRGRSQITLPKELTKRMNISEGDKFEIYEKDGGIFMCPVIVYPKDKLDKLAQKIKKLERETKSKSYTDVNKMFKDMGIDID